MACIPTGQTPGAAARGMLDVRQQHKLTAGSQREREVGRPEGVGAPTAWTTTLCRGERGERKARTPNPRPRASALFQQERIIQGRGRAPAPHAGTRQAYRIVR